ncbi:hypothetical protein [Pseudorhodobacter aquimaris]|uniref:hypothetical protein n=1 Tax=Pseudorhodobacter aquimaris TaxID=687412 RepID=UPI00067CBC76|nr:hypothetical protein [Pseudorhodobacter aquimaris]
MDFQIPGRTTTPAAPIVEVQKPVESKAEATLLPAPLSVEEARAAAETANEPRERSAIIRALLSNPPASPAELSLATQIAAKVNAASSGYASAIASLDGSEKQ